MNRIFVFGDSIVFGVGEAPCIGWVGRLKADFELQGKQNKIFNLGIPGDNSTDVLQRIDGEMNARTELKEKRDKFTIILGIGTNDSRVFESIITPDLFRANVRKLIHKSGMHADEVIFISLLPVVEEELNAFGQEFFTNANSKKFNEIIRDECSRASVLFCDLFSLWESKDYSEWFEDGLHPNSYGYDIMYEQIKTFLARNNVLT